MVGSIAPPPRALLLASGLLSPWSHDPSRAMEPIEETMSAIEQIMSWGSVAIGFAAAWLWYRVSTVTVRQSKGGLFLPGDPPIDIYSTVSEASRITKQAAIATALSVLLQSLATLAKFA